MVEQAILFFEARITVEQIDIEVDDWAEGVLRIRIDYTVRSTNSRNNMVYPMYFREGTALPVTAAHE
jgi:phage baseplate assembly protein W